MNDWELTKFILKYTFWVSMACFFFLAVIVRVVIDYFTFFSSWFRSESSDDTKSNLEIERKKMRENIFKEISEERERQDLKFGPQNHRPAEWCMILGEEVGEVQKAALESYFRYEGKNNDYSDYRKELIQVAAVAIAMIESYDRNRK